MKRLQTFLYQKKIQKKSIDEQTIFYVFSRIICEEYGRRGEKNIIPKFYNKHILYITFTHSVWAQEVWMRRAELIKLLNKKIGNRVIYDIKTSH